MKMLSSVRSICLSLSLGLFLSFALSASAQPFAAGQVNPNNGTNIGRGSGSSKIAITVTAGGKHVKAAHVAITTSTGATVMTGDTDSHGKYKTMTPPGTYTVTATTEDMIGTASVTTDTTTPGKVTIALAPKP